MRMRVLIVAALLMGAANTMADEPADLLSVERVKKGKALFSEACSYCHGEDGIGGESGAPSLQGRKDLSAAELFETITKGRINGMNIMPAWGDSLSEEQRWGLVGFVRSMVGVGK